MDYQKFSMPGNFRFSGYVWNKANEVNMKTQYDMRNLWATLVFTRTKYYVRNPKLGGNARSYVLMHALAFSTANHRRTSTNVGLSKPNDGWAL